MNSTRLENSLLLKSEFRKRSENSHAESFTSVIEEQADPAFGPVHDVRVKSGSAFALEASCLCRLILPLAGAFNALLNDKLVEVFPEELLVVPAYMNCSIQNNNPQPVNFVIFDLKAGEAIASHAVFPVELKSYNTLFKTGTSGAVAGYDAYVGVFKSRGTTVFKPGSAGSRLLLYVVDGSFEVEGRLLEFRDTLLLWENSDIELEALAENSIICLIEYDK